MSFIGKSGMSGPSCQHLLQTLVADGRIRKKFLATLLDLATSQPLACEIVGDGGSIENRTRGESNEYCHVARPCLVAACLSVMGE